jgi:hypothetical protein
MPKKSIFISKANSLTRSQQGFVESLHQILKERQLEPRTLGETDFPNETPLGAVKSLLGECEGCIVLGFTQMVVTEGVLKPDTGEQKDISNVKLPTTWNHIETAMAFMKGIPIMIICESGIQAGIFDKGITDRYIHQTDLGEGWLRSPRFLQPFNNWLEEVTARRAPDIMMTGVVRPAANDRLRDLLYPLLFSNRFKWRSLERLAAGVGLTEEEIASALRDDPKVRFSIGRSGKRIVGLRSRVD